MIGEILAQFVLELVCECLSAAATSSAPRPAREERRPISSSQENITAQDLWDDEIDGPAHLTRS